jgi:L-iditol 2-dehydrogenase
MASRPYDAPDTSIEVARLHAAGDLRLAREAAPLPGEDEVRVTVLAVGLCGSDLHWFEEGSIGESTLDHPLVLGHEFSGRLDDGTLVVADPCISCGICGPCRAGTEHLCERSRFAGHSVTDGALRTVMTWPERLLRPVPAGTSAEEAALLEPLGVALHAVDLARVAPGETAAVLGCGPIGLLLIQVLIDRGFGRVLAADPLPHRSAAAARFGAEIIDSSVEVSGDIAADIVFEAAGTDASLATAIELARPGGRIVIIGIPAGDRTSYPAGFARRKELTLQLCRRMEPADLDRAIALAASERVDLAGLISHRFELEAIPRAFATLAARTGIKVIVAP